MWWPDPLELFYWPKNVPRECTLQAFALAFNAVGFVKAKNGDSSKRFEKIALYATMFGQPQHAARQLDTGKWSSKLGPDIDIEHTLAGLEGPTYGQVVGFFQRRKGRAR